MKKIVLVFGIVCFSLFLTKIALAQTFPPFHVKVRLCEQLPCNEDDVELHGNEQMLLSIPAINKTYLVQPQYICCEHDTIGYWFKFPLNQIVPYHTKMDYTVWYGCGRKQSGTIFYNILDSWIIMDIVPKPCKTYLPTIHKGVPST